MRQMRFRLRGMASLFMMVMVVSASVASAQPSLPDERVPIWDGIAPTGDGRFEEREVWLTVYRPAKPNRTAVIICPGGGYGGHAIEPEGHGIARWLNTHGITGFVLQYRLPAGRPFVPILDVHRSIRIVRGFASRWDIDPTKIGIIGFSAGGHLASTAATHFDNGAPDSLSILDRVSCRPDFAILIYPVISMGEKTHGGSKKNLLGPEPSAKLVDLFSNEKQVNETTPPTFLAHAKDDTVVVLENSQLFHDALKAHNVPTQLLVLPSGGHGLNGYQGPNWDAWQDQSMAWLKELKLAR